MSTTPVAVRDDDRTIASFERGPADAIDLSRVDRVLVVMLRHHGDVLLTSPVFRVLKAARPALVVDALVYRETLPMLAFNPDVAHVHCVEREWKRRGVLGHAQAEWDLLKRLRGARYDLVVLLTDHRRGAWTARGIGPRYAVAPRLRDAGGLAGRFWNGSFTHRYANSSSVPSGAALARRHTVEQNLDALRRIGIPIDEPPALTMVPGAAGEQEADTLLARLGVTGDFIAMQPTSRWMFKCWSVEANAGLIAALLARDETIVLSCAPDARERAMLRAIAARAAALRGGSTERLKLADDDGTLSRLAATIGRAKLFIGIDSAPMHIAAAMQTPTVALFGPSGEFNWGPWRVPHRVVTSDAYPCRPCGQDGCGGGKISDCLVKLPVSRVLDAVDDLLREVDARNGLRFA
jgi:heptosyltransferase-3